MTTKNEKWIDEKINANFDSFTDLFDGEKESYKSDIEPFETFKQKQMLAFKEKVEGLYAQYQKAFDLILERLIKSNDRIKEVSKKKALLTEIKIGQEHLKKVIDSEKLTEKINQGKKSFLSILKYSHETIQTFYDLGQMLFDEQKYEDALAMFTFLALLEPGCHQFWLKEAMCLQALGKLEEAIEVFQLAETTDKTDPLPAFFASECYSRLQDRPHAITAAEHALEIAGKHTEEAYIDFVKSVTKWKEELMR